jgi:hypothetical protein
MPAAEISLEHELIRKTCSRFSGSRFSTSPRPDMASGVPEMRHFSGKFNANAPAKLNQP